MSRPFTDIAKSKNSQPIKNGTTITSTTFTGTHNTNNTNVKNTPAISSIQSKYGNRFYNGIFVQLVGDQTLVGG
jgi:hypothetical protein